jgi:hypothetical protein
LEAERSEVMEEREKEGTAGRLKMRTVLGAVLLGFALIVHPSSLVPAQAQILPMQIFFVPNSTRSVSISISTNVLNPSTTFYNFGGILVGSAAVSHLSIVVTNTGNMGVTLGLQVSSTAVDMGVTAPIKDWTLSTSTFTGVDTFALFAVFQSAAPGNGQYADLNHWVNFNSGNNFNNPGAATLASATQYAGTGSGYLVPAASTPGANPVNLWLNLFAPTISSNLHPKQFTVTLTAN